MIGFKILHPCKIFLAVRTFGSDLWVWNYHFHSGHTDAEYFPLVYGPCKLCASPQLRVLRGRKHGIENDKIFLL